MGGLALEDPERRKVAAALDDRQDAVDAQRADQLVLQVVDAGEEPEGLQVGARGGGAEAGPLQAAPDEAFLRGVVEAGQAYAEPVRPERLQVVPDVRGAAGRRDQHALAREVAAEPFGDGQDGGLVAGPFDQDDGAPGSEGAGHAG